MVGKTDSLASYLHVCLSPSTLHKNMSKYWQCGAFILPFLLCKIYEEV